MKSKLVYIEEQPKSYTGIYSMHKYWSKKPFNVISKYIETYSDPDDIVLDPFSGSGISNVESIFLNRRTLGIDINPMSMFITKQMLSNPSISDLEKAFMDLECKIRGKINDLYKFTIRGKEVIGTHFIYKNGKLIEVWYKEGKTKKIEKIEDASKLKSSKNITYENIKTHIPTEKMIHNSRINAKDSMMIYDLFTPRNTLGLSILLHEINSIKNTQVRDFFRFCFTSCTGQASKMVFVINNRKKGRTSNKKEVGSWVIGYWIPKEHFEINVWNCFLNRYKRNLKTKRDFADHAPDVRYVENFKKLQSHNGNICLVNDSCYNTLKTLPSNSVDYIITDPPHGDRLPYLELSMMWNSWLGFKTNMENELVVSDAKIRNKTTDVYVDLLDKILKEICRVLKKDRHFTLMFNSYDDKVWRQLQNILFKLDLELVDINTIGYSATSVIQDTRKGGLKTDFIFTFKKKKAITHTKQKNASKKMINTLISNYTKTNKDYLLYELLNNVIIHLLKNRLVFDISFVVSSINSHFKQDVT